MTEFAIATLFF